MEQERIISNSTMKNKLYNSTATAQLGSHDITKSALKNCIIQVLNSHPPDQSVCSATIYRISNL